MSTVTKAWSFQSTDGNTPPTIDGWTSYLQPVTTTSLLAAPLNPNTGNIPVQPGTGVNFHIATYATLTSPFISTKREIVFITGVNGDVLNVFRGEQSTSAQSWNTDDVITNSYGSGLIPQWNPSSAPGSPSGCLALSLSAPEHNFTTFNYWEILGTWEQLFGIPPHSTIQTLSSISYSWQCSCLGTSGVTGPLEILDADGIIQITLVPAVSFSGVRSWVTASGGIVSIPAALQASSSLIKIRLANTITATPGPNNLLTLEQDQVSITVNYQGAPALPQPTPPVAAFPSIRFVITRGFKFTPNTINFIITAGFGAYAKLPIIPPRLPGAPIYINGDLIDDVNEFLADLMTRRGLAGRGGNPHRFLELYGGHIVEATAFEPDPATYRHTYYYNVKLNRLYKRIITTHKPEIGIISAYWQPCSN